MGKTRTHFHCVQINGACFVFAQMLLRGITGLLIVLSALELCVTISAVVLGIKALRKRAKEGNKVEYYLTF